MAKMLFGVDLGGTTVKMGLFDETGTRLHEWEIPTRKENSGEQILPDIAASIRETVKERGISEADVLGVGIGVPGAVDAAGTVLQAVNLFTHVYFYLPVPSVNDDYYEYGEDVPHCPRNGR